MEPNRPTRLPAAGIHEIAARLGPIFWLAVIWLAMVLFAAVTAGYWPVPPPDRMDWAQLGAAPGAPLTPAGTPSAENPQAGGAAHWLGTDTMGRDMVARLIFGARVSLAVSICSPAIGFLVGGLLGCLAGYYRGRLDAGIVATMDVILAFPGLVLLLVIRFYLGASLTNLILILGFLTIPAFSRVARAKTLGLTELEFVQAARLTGAGHLSILVREILPNVVIPLAVYALLVAAFMIMAEGALSFLGLGVPPPTASWGGMIAEGREALDTAPHVSLIPAGVMFLTVLALNLIGDGLRSLLEGRAHP
ncbi:MAG: ABC transporter permease [Desulfosarcinaceae bacterium]|nr:ABC transporter permease [Desulfosarcinaceae bacterium]